MKSSKPSNVVQLKSENREDSRLDWLKWAVAITLLLAGLIGNHYYSEVSMAIRTVGWLMILAVACFVASKTQKGALAVEFFNDSRMELRKVVWPTKDETMQMTLVVAVMVVILALILWGMDSVLVWVIGRLTGQIG